MDKSKNLLKISIVGDVGSGKTWLWQSYLQNRKPSSYEQTIFDNYCTSVSYNGQEVQISIFETCGEDEYAHLRKITYPGTNVVILCVAVDNPDFATKQEKLKNLEKWSQELKEHCKGVPVLVIGTKKDLRDDPEVIRCLGAKMLKPLKFKDIVGFSKKFKNSVALDCSSVSKDGLQTVFQTAVKLGLRNKSCVKP